MKLVIAYIRPECLSAVKHELANREIRHFSVMHASGSGRQKLDAVSYRGILTDENFSSKIRLEIGVNDNFVEPAVTAISKSAKTGKEGDGVIFILECAAAIRIRSLENGPEAMG